MSFTAIDGKFYPQWIELTALNIHFFSFLQDIPVSIGKVIHEVNFGGAILSLSEKAKDLALAVKDTEEYKTLTSAQTRVKLDPAASDLIEQLQSVQEQLQATQAEGKQVSPDQIQQYQTLEEQAKANITLTSLLKAQQAFGELMNQVNQSITQELFNS